MIDERPWPEFLKEWHRKRVRITTAASRTIEDIMVNVTKPGWFASPRNWATRAPCKCQEIRRSCTTATLVDGCVLMTGREFMGEEEKAMRN